MEDILELTDFEDSEKFIKKTIKLFENDAKQENPEAINMLGNIYKQGFKSIICDYKMAVKMYEKAINLGYRESITNLALMYYEGTHPDGKNLEKAEKLYKKAINLGSHSAAYKLSHLYYFLKRYKDCLEMVTKAIEMGSTYSIMFLGDMYFLGTHPGGININKAEELFKKAIDLGLEIKYPNVLYNLGAIYYDKGLYKEAEELYTKAVDLGCDRAMNSLADMYYNGDLPEGKDIIKAIELYSMAVKLDNESAINSLADIYYNFNYFRNEERAEKLYNRGIELGNSTSMYKLAKMYYERQQYSSDTTYNKDIYELLDSLVKLNHIQGIRLLANSYESGRHPDSKNYSKAVELYIKAFELGHKKSLINISQIYRDEHYNNHEKYKELYEQVTDITILSKCIKPHNLLKRVYNDINKDNCVICHNTLLNTNNELRTTTCGHVFHLECSFQIDGCPVCRSIVKKICHTKNNTVYTISDDSDIDD